MRITSDSQTPRTGWAEPGALTTFTDNTVVDLPIHEAFESILAVGQTGRSGSYFSAQVQAAVPGQVIRTVVPVAIGHEIRVEPAVARLVEYRPYRRLVIAQETPWESRTDIRLQVVAGSTLISSRTTVPEQTLELVATMLDGTVMFGSDTQCSDDTEVQRIALVTSMSGHSSVYGRSTVNCAKLAEHQINREGGILGKPISVALIDDASSPEQGLKQLRDLDRRCGVVAAVGVHSSAIATVIDRSGWAARKPYVYAPLAESTLPQRTLIAVGDTEQDQLALAIPHLTQTLRRGARWALIGSDFSWPREVNRAARARIAELGGVVVGEHYVHHTRPNIGALFTRVQAARPDVIVSSLVGWGLIEFEELMYRSGLRDSIRSLTLLMDDCSRELLGEAGYGVWSAMSYFPSLQSTENQRFVREYRARYGPLAPPISALGESVYEALLLLARSANLTGGFDPQAIRSHIGRVPGGVPRGALLQGKNGRMRARMHLAQATESGWQIHASS